MAVYNYYAKDSQGLSLTGIMEATVIDEVISHLRKKDLIIISVKETRVKAVIQRKVRLEDLVIFSRQFATLIEAGITIVHALQILKDQTKSKTLALAIINIRDQILNGETLYGAMERFPKIFSPLYISLVRTGETAGLLNETLSRLATYVEKSAALKRKIKSALVYPVVVVSMAIIITTTLLVKVVPTFEMIFTTLGGQLPLPTQILIFVSLIVRKFFLVALGAIVLVLAGFKKYISTPDARYKYDSTILFLPIFGELIQKAIIAKFARTLSTLVKSAIPIIQALAIVGKVTDNKLIEQALNKAGNAIRHKETIAEPLSRSGAFTPMVVGMISVGEQTGQLERMLSKIADVYEDEVETAISGLTSLIEPLVIGFLGIVIGGIVLALFMPIFKILELIH